VTPRSRAATNNLDGGDLVLGINRKVVVDLADFRAQMGAKPSLLVLNLQRGSARGELQMD
jgi:S1-C subfamily serine protease